MKTYEHHDLHKSPEYRAWGSMIQRCHNKNSQSYPRYGAKGVIVYVGWRNSFTEFYKDLGPRPSNKHSLDRVNNDLGYFPGNCRWATTKVQMDNRSVTRKLNGMTLKEASEKYGIPLGRIQDRVRRGLPTEKILATESLLNKGRRKNG